MTGVNSEKLQVLPVYQNQFHFTTHVYKKQTNVHRNLHDYQCSDYGLQNYSQVRWKWIEACRSFLQKCISVVDNKGFLFAAEIQPVGLNQELFSAREMQLFGLNQDLLSATEMQLFGLNQELVSARELQIFDPN